MRNILDISPNHSKKIRPKKQIKFVIIHYTGMQSEIESVRRLKDFKSKVSCHYLINRRGVITNMVNDKHIAWHAGKSKWKSFSNLNNFSIGIELVNKGHRLGYQNFPNPQIKSLIKLCLNVKRKYKIKKDNFLGHSDIAPLRKIDPGEKFPWEKLSEHKLGAWYKLSSRNFNKRKTKKNLKFFFRDLYKIGYRYFKIKKRVKKDQLVVKAFQQRYLPEKATGKIDKKTQEIANLLAKNK